MFSSRWKIISLIVAVVISVLVIKQSTFNRWFGYETIPGPITDEFTYVWQGLSLRKFGLPMAWTMNAGIYSDVKYNPKLGKVDGFVINVNDQKIDLNHYLIERRPLYAVDEIDFTKGLEQIFITAPFFDHPPLGGLIYSYGIDKNVTELDQVKAAAFRKPALVLAVITAVLIFLLLFSLTVNPWEATLGVMVYSVAPTYLLATRTAFLENVVAPISLLQLILLFWAIKKKPNYLMFGLSGLMAGLGVLAKEPAISFVIADVILLIINKIPRKQILSFVVLAAIPILGYLVWGLWLQKDLFLEIFLSNASRGYFGAIKPITMLEALKFKNFPTDGWWIWGFVSLIIISIRQKNDDLKFITIPLALQLLTLWMLGSSNYPWYLISSIPWLAICGAIMIWKIAKKPTIATAAAFFFIPFSSSYYWGRVALNLSASINHYRMVFVVFFAFLFFRLKFSKSKIVSIIWFLFLAVLIQKVVVYTQLFMPYLMAHWGNLPVPNLPNF